MRHSKSHFKLNRFEKLIPFSSITISQAPGRRKIQGQARQKEATRKAWPSLNFSRAVIWRGPWCNRCWALICGTRVEEHMCMPVNEHLQLRCCLSSVFLSSLPLFWDRISLKLSSPILLDWPISHLDWSVNHLDWPILESKASSWLRLPELR